MRFVKKLINSWLDVKVENDKKDVGFIHDLIFGLQNLISIEHHCIESYSTTGRKIYLEIATKIRRNRSKWMYKFIKESDGQNYCISKHLLASAQAMKEIGNRFIEQNDEKSAKECFDESTDYEGIFILLNDLDKNNNYKKDNILDAIKSKFGGKNV